MRTPVSTIITPRIKLSTNYIKLRDYIDFTCDLDNITCDSELYTCDMTRIVWQISTSYITPRKEALLLWADWLQLLCADWQQISLAWWQESNKIQTIWK